MMSSTYPVQTNPLRTPWVNQAQYQAMYAQSLLDPEGFWGMQGQRLNWIKPYRRVKNTSYDYPHVSIKWYEDGTLNACVNCLDRHLASRGDQTALIWEGDSPDEAKHISYNELYDQVCRFANALKAKGVRKGDVITLYMPMIPETAVAMLACARIGAVHSVVFGGFSAEALSSRIQNGNSRVVITADQGLRAGKQIPLKQNVDEAIAAHGAGTVESVIVVRRTGADIAWTESRDCWYDQLVAHQSKECPPEEMSAEDPLFILYTSGSTGAPKGVVHTTGGYLVYASLTHQYAFDYHEGEIYWCTADFGWITGHSYILYGPLSNGATSLIFEGVPTYPSSARLGQIVDKHQVNILYTAPTAIRALMADGEQPLQSSSRRSLRILASVGEPINPQAWEWYYHQFGESRCPVVDTWWQTETGGVLICPLPGATNLKPGSATLPFFGIQPAMVDNEGAILDGATEGNLVILDSWPGQMRTIFGDHERFVQTYFSTFKGAYFTGDGARRDEDGYYWITGRVDDVLNVSGHRMGTAEIESSLVAHPKVAEAAVVGFPHHLKGQGIFVYVTLNPGEEPREELRKELVNWVRKDIGAIASPDIIQWTQDLPKTRSGKIMRRILRKIAANELDSLGDTSTLANPSVVDDLIECRRACN